MSPLTVIKLGGSVLTGDGAFDTAATWLADWIGGANGDVRGLVVVVSAPLGTTDALLADARRCAGRAPDADARDLLWSTGERRSVALLTLALRARGVPAIGLSEGETGLSVDAAGGVKVNPLPIRAAAAHARVVVVPGFLALDGGRVVTLGRGGSDRSAVALAVGLDAARCVLIKDVDGYFSADPKAHPDAIRLPRLSIDSALALAAEGCDLVQPAALRDAQAHRLPLIVRSVSHPGTLVSPTETPVDERRTPGVFLRIS